MIIKQLIFHPPRAWIFWIVWAALPILAWLAMKPPEWMLALLSLLLAGGTPLMFRLNREDSTEAKDRGQ